MQGTTKDRGVRNWPSPPQFQKVSQILLDYDNLRDLGITYSKEHLRRLEADGLFPNRVRLSAARVAWVYHEVMAWITEREKAREQTSPEMNGEVQ